ncbi:MAG: SGNH/GDSL hydrolase family protein [Propionibacteriaceae bacterium]
MKTTLTLAVAGLALATLNTFPVSASAANISYVALGDSYSAGVGTRSSTEFHCYRSPEGYPALLASQHGWNLNYQACSGAVISDIMTNQIQALSPTTNYVTVTGGGNDAGFAPILVDCILPGWMGNCHGKLDTAAKMLKNILPQRLDTLYSAIQKKAPQAKTIVVGYPLLFNGTNCHPLTFFTADEMSRMDSLTMELNTLMKQKAAKYGLAFADARPSFRGHAVCDSQPWINNISLPVVESFHPNDAGNNGYAAVVAKTFGVSFSETSNLRYSTTNATAAIDYATVAPELASPANLRRAVAAGISKEKIIGIDRDLRSGDLTRAKAAYAALQALDATYEASH